MVNELREERSYVLEMPKKLSYRRPIGGPEKLLVCFLVPKEEAARESPAKEKGKENDKPRVSHNQQSPPAPISISHFATPVENPLQR